MASTNQTTHYGLPQYIGTDQAEWTDTNTPFAEVDSDLYTAKQNADSALAGIDGVALELNDLKVSVLGLQSSILGLRTDVNFNTANITEAMNDIDALEIDVSKLKLDVTDLIVSELPKKIDTFSGVVEDDQQTSYTAVTADGIAYDETNQQLLLKVDGADTVIPFSRGGGASGYIKSAMLVSTSDILMVTENGVEQISSSSSDSVVADWITANSDIVSAVVYQNQTFTLTFLKDGYYSYGSYGMGEPPTLHHIGETIQMYKAQTGFLSYFGDTNPFS